MKNFLDHETEVRFIDGLLAKNTEWQWFVNYIENNYELTDISDYKDFIKRSAPLRRLLDNFINLIKVSDKHLEITSDVLKDVYDIASFSIGVVSANGCSDNMRTNMGRILFVNVWLTKLENSDNETEYLIDLRFMTLKNFSHAIEMQSFDAVEDDIIACLNSVSVVGFDEPKECIINNLNRVSFEANEDFFNKYGQNLLSVNAFSFQEVEKDAYLTWEEETLLDMLSVSISERKITPALVMNKTIFPDCRLWTSKQIGMLKSYFNNSIANFVLESIDYIQNGVIPDKDIIDTHCRLLKGLLLNGDDSEVYTSSTYIIVSSLFSDGSMNSIKYGDVLDLIKNIQLITSMTLLLKLSEDGFPLSKNQKTSIRQYVTDQFKSIKGINDGLQLKDYLCNKDIAKHITQPYYDMVMPKFMDAIKDPQNKLVPTLFYKAMVFLINVNQTNLQVDRRIVKRDMIQLQECWQHSIYEEQCKNLERIGVGTSVSTKQIKMYNKCVLANPTLLAQACLILSVDDMINTMKSISENAIVYMIKRIILSPFFPIEGNGVNFDNHEIDTLLRKQVEDIKAKYGYKFLNVLDTDIYVSGIHERFKSHAYTSVNMFEAEKNLYKLVEKSLQVKLLPYKKHIQLGHLTQLFPLLEIQIRELGKKYGIVPFKEKTSDFMKMKDPSSVLLQLLETIYSVSNSFEKAPDLLFIYHFMYNANSLNIRNECIHGRDYLKEERLKFAFKVTLLSMYMIIIRLKTIKENSTKEEMA